MLGWPGPYSQYHAANAFEHRITEMMLTGKEPYNAERLLLSTGIVSYSMESNWENGRTSPPSVTGQVVRSSSQTVTTFGLDFNFRRNALPTKPPPVEPGGDVPAPIYTGTLVGSVGLYEIRFRVPPVPQGTPPCAGVDPRSLQTGNIVYSNLTVSIGGTHSFDGAGICVAVDESD